MSSTHPAFSYLDLSIMRREFNRINRENWQKDWQNLSKERKKQRRKREIDALKKYGKFTPNAGLFVQKYIDLIDKLEDFLKTAKPQNNFTDSVVNLHSKLNEANFIRINSKKDFSLYMELNDVEIQTPKALLPEMRFYTKVQSVIEELIVLGKYYYHQDTHEQKLLDIMSGKLK